jgi:hypothetical protein
MWTADGGGQEHHPAQEHGERRERRAAPDAHMGQGVRRHAQPSREMRGMVSVVSAVTMRTVVS